MSEIRVGSKVRTRQGRVVWTVKRTGEYLGHPVAWVCSERSTQRVRIKDLVTVEGAGRAAERAPERRAKRKRADGPQRPAESTQGPAVGDLVRVGDIVQVGRGRTLWDVEDTCPGGRAVLRDGRRRSTAAVERLSIVHMADDPDVENRWGRLMCGKCARISVSSSRTSRWQHCQSCGRDTLHEYAGAPEAHDYRTQVQVSTYEREQEQAARDLQVLQASLDMLDQLGIRVSVCELREEDAIIHAERGRGKTTWFLYLDERLTIRDQVVVLGNCWRFMLPANNDHWMKDWIPNEKDPELEWREVWWEHERAIIDDTSAARALRWQGER